MKSRYAFLPLLKSASPTYTELVKMASAQAVENILNAVGRENVPHDLDREALRIAIGDADAGRHIGSDLFGGSQARARLKHIRRIRKTVEKLATLLKDDVGADVDLMIALQLRLPTAAPMGAALRSVVPIVTEVQRAVANIERMQEGIAEKWRTAHEHDLALRGRRVTEAEWLAGVTLPLVYERHFLKRAGRSRNKENKPSGPMVRFISATMKELGLTYSEEAILRAYTRRSPLRAEQRKGKKLPLILRQC